jgi:hypothetical protein
MAAALQVIAKWAIPVGLAVGGVQSAMYDGKITSKRRNTKAQDMLNVN